MPEWNEVSLQNLGGGAAIERFNDALAEVIDNILDLNTPATKVREIKLLLKIKPDEDRGRVQYHLHVDKKIAQPSAVGSTFFLGKKSGRCVAYEQDINQGELFEDEKKALKLREVQP